MPKSDIERQHDALVSQIAREPEKFFCGSSIAGKKIYVRAEPWSFGRTNKRVDGFVVFQMPTTFEIIVFELKLGRSKINDGYAQLKTVVDFFSDADRWLEWAKQILKTVAEPHEVWLTIELLTAAKGEDGKIESYNLFPNYLLPKRRFVGFYPCTPAQSALKPKLMSPTGISVRDYLATK